MVVTTAWKRDAAEEAGAEQAGPAVDAAPARRRDLERLIAAAQAGEHGALGKLLDAARSYLLAIAARELPADVRPHLAPSDVVQETAIEIQVAFAGFAGDSASQFLGWLRGILLHNVSDAIRRRRAYQRALDRHASAPPRGAPPDRDTARRSPVALLRPTEASAIRRDDAGLVARVLATLGDDARRVVHLRYWEGLSFVEIGGRIGRSDEAVRKVWYRAVARLQSELGHHSG